MNLERRLNGISMTKDDPSRAVDVGIIQLHCRTTVLVPNLNLWSLMYQSHLANRWDTGTAGVEMVRYDTLIPVSREVTDMKGSKHREHKRVHLHLVDGYNATAGYGFTSRR